MSFYDCASIDSFNIPVNSMVKLPRQERAVATVRAILDASTSILNGGDPAQFTTNRVAEVAGVSIGTLYQYFANKDALLAAVLERGIMDVEDGLRSLSARTDAPLADAFSTLLNHTLEWLEQFGPLVRVVLSNTPLLSRNGIITTLESKLIGFLHLFLLSQPHVRLRYGAVSMHVAVNGIAITSLRWVAERPTWMTRKEVVSALTDQFMSQLEPIEPLRNP